MNIHDEMSDSEVLRAAAGMLSAWPVPAAPQPAAVMARGRARRRRRLAGAGASAGVVVAGAALGISAGLPGSPARTGSHLAAVAGLTAVRGCPGLYATAGTLERVTGASLVIRSLMTGRPLTLATSSATAINHEAPGTLADVTNGARVFVAGSGTGRPALAAHWVITGMDLLGRDRTVHHGRTRGHLSVGNVAVGTAADASPGGFTVIMGPGVRVPVTTSGQTTFLTMQQTGISGLRTGEMLDAAVTAGPDGTLTAATIDQGSDLPIADGSPAAAGCSPSAAAAAFLPSA